MVTHDVNKNKQIPRFVRITDVKNKQTLPALFSSVFN